MTAFYSSRKFLLALSLLANVLLIGFFSYRYLYRSQPKTTFSYLDNYQYKEQTAIFSAYSSNCEVAFLGDSHIYKAHWDELLGTTACNRGIGSDIVKGMYNRISGVISSMPKYCFIHGGANDIELNINPDTTLHYYRGIVDSLLVHKIQPVIMEITHVGKDYPNSGIINERADRINARLKTLITPAIRIDVDQSDLQPDQIHLNASGYNKWKIEIQSYLNRK